MKGNRMDEKTCVMCEEPIPPRRYQNHETVRACRPGCAGRLFHRENPKWVGVGEYDKPS
jgi:hypothetical protein